MAASAPAAAAAATIATAATIAATATAAAASPWHVCDGLGPLPDRRGTPIDKAHRTKVRHLIDLRSLLSLFNVLIKMRYFFRILLR